MISLSFVLCSLLILEFIFRSVLEFNQMRFSGKKIPLAWLHCIPLLNDFIPMRDLQAAKPQETPFIKAHEAAHRQMNHHTLRVIIRFLGIGFLFFILIYAWNYWNASLLQSIILFHFTVSFLQIILNAISWFQEYEADNAAFKKTGFTQAEKNLKALQQKEIPKLTLYALLYREHPTAHSRLEKIRKNKK